MHPARRFRLATTVLLSLALVLVARGPVFAQDSDTTPPALTSMTLVTPSIDVTLGPQVVTFHLSATDDLSGIQSVGVYLTSPTSAQSAQGYGYWWSPTGPVLDGALDVAVTIPRYAQAGVWTVNSVTLWDSAGNHSTYPGSVLAAAGYPTTVTVVDATPDLDAPVLAAVAMTPGSIDVSSGAVTVQVDLTITDDTSGTLMVGDDYANWVVTMTSPSGRQNVHAGNYQFSLTSGTANNGTWRAVLSIPRYAEAGTWTVSNVAVRDAARNLRYYTATDLEPYGASVDLAVASAPQDLAPPVPTALRFVPAFVDTSAGPQTVQVEIDATDDLSGVRLAPTTPNLSWIYGPYMESPSGAQWRYPSPWSWSALTGTPQDGTWTNSFSLPQYSEAGTWSVSWFRFEDDAHNEIYLNRQQYAALGLTSTLTVIKPSLVGDGTVGSGGGTVTDEVFGERAKLTFPAGAVATDTAVAIDVLESPIVVPMPTGFSGADTYFVNIKLTPEPAFPLPAPGLTLVLPTTVQMTPGAAMSLFRINPATGLLEASLDAAGNAVVGTVDSTGNSATFTGISRLSTVVGLRPEAVQLRIDIKPGDAVNRINLKARGLLPVLIYGKPDLDVSRIDLASLRLAGARVAKNPRCRYRAHLVDFDRDGSRDVIVHFEIRDLKLAAGATKARLDGKTLDKRAIWGEDAIRLVR